MFNYLLFEIYFNGLPWLLWQFYHGLAGSVGCEFVEVWQLKNPCTVASVWGFRFGNQYFLLSIYLVLETPR